jgi:hypothetical protein
VVGDHEAAGAIPVIQTTATDPRMGHETTNLVGWGSNPLGGSEPVPGCSSEAERVGDNHDVAGAIPVIQTKVDLENRSS